jgi:hypothetical protein
MPLLLRRIGWLWYEVTGDPSDRVPGNPGNGRRAVGKSTCGASHPTSDVWTAPPDPTSVHAKPLKSRQFPAFRTERQDLAKSVHLQLPNALRCA